MSPLRRVARCTTLCVDTKFLASCGRSGDSVRPSRDPTRPHVDPRSTGRSPSTLSRPLSRRLFDDRSPDDEDFLLLDDLTVLVGAGLLEERPSPSGPVFALTPLGRDTPEFGT